MAGPSASMPENEIVGQVRGAREDELRRRRTSMNDTDGIEQPRQDRTHLVDAAPWEQRHHGPGRVKTEARQEGVARLRGLRDVEQRMAYPLDRDSGAPVDLFLEGKDDQHAIGDALHGLHPSRAPGPQLRADVVHHRHAEPSHRVCQPEIEVRVIDRHEHVRPGGLGMRQEPAIDRVRAGQHARHLEKARHRQTLKVGNQLGAGAAKPLAAETGNGRGWIDLEKFAGERAGVHVPGRLAAGNHDAHGSRTAPTQAS